MTSPATASSLDVAYWFFGRAEQDGIYLEDEKLHHLLFLAQSRFASVYDAQMLMPCLFLCNEDGFFEPTIKKILSQGRPFMPPVKLKEKITVFLEQIWQEYGAWPVLQCKRLITGLSLYSQTFQPGTITVLSWNSLVDNSNECGTIGHIKERQFQPSKVLVSQNGPVLVSQWKPRKVNRISNKDYLS